MLYFFQVLLTSYLLSVGSNYSLKVTQLNGQTGTLYIGFYNSVQTYADTDTPDFSVLHKVQKAHTALVPIKNLPKGTYAVAVFLDTNGNGKLDTNLFGVPTELYGFSRNPKIMFSAPNFEDVKVDFSATSAPVIIKMQ